MKVDKRKIQTPDEEYKYLFEKLGEIGNFFSWEVHPNVVRNADIQRKKIYKKIKKLVDSAEFQEYNPHWKTKE